MAMNPEIKARWIAALRGGEYTQGFSQLTMTDNDGNRRHCCLGVLCDLAVNDGESNIISIVELNGDVAYKAVDDEFSEKHYLPYKVARWAGMTVGLDEDTRGEFTDSEDNERNLAAENDIGSSFADIADLIEQYF